MVSYVLLVVIAVGLSVLVYNYLRLNIGTEQQECPADTSIIILESECTIFSADDKKISLHLENRGLFNIEAAFIRMKPQGREIGIQINRNNNEFFNPPIVPGNASWYEYDITDAIASTTGSYVIEVQPAIFDDTNALVPCDTIISQQVQCTLP